MDSRRHPGILEAALRGIAGAMLIEIETHDGIRRAGKINFRRMTFRSLENLHEVLDLVLPHVNFSRISHLRARRDDGDGETLIDARIRKVKNGFEIDQPFPPYTAPIRRKHVEELVQEVFVYLMKA